MMREAGSFRVLVNGTEGEDPPHTRTINAKQYTIRVIKMTNYLSNSPTFTYTSLPVTQYRNAPRADQSAGGGSSRSLSSLFAAFQMTAATFVRIWCLIHPMRVLRGFFRSENRSAAFTYYAGSISVFSRISRRQCGQLRRLFQNIIHHARIRASNAVAAT